MSEVWAILATMLTARFHFHGDLEVFLRREHVGTEAAFTFSGAPSLKDSIEALGVPHPEVAGICVDGLPAAFEAPTPGGARIDVYGPDALPGGVEPSSRLLPEPPDPRRFALDGHLGRLAGLLRMLGFDAWWRAHVDDPELAAISEGEERILLTRDVGLLKRGNVRHGRFVRATQPKEQAVEIVERYALGQRARPFTRCIRCNGVLEQASAAEVAERVPAGARERHRIFTVCRDCGRVFWQGTHHARMAELVDALLCRSGS
jgi:uncharacterized protein